MVSVSLRVESEIESVTTLMAIEMMKLFRADGK